MSSQNATTTTTVCKITNTTDSTLILIASLDLEGHVNSNSCYPSQIPPKATVSFYHVGTPGSAGVVVYRSIVNADKAYDIGILWNNQPNSLGGVFTWVSPAEYHAEERRGAIHEQQLLNAKSNSVGTLDGLTSAVEMGPENFPTLSATISYNPQLA